jgi:hypothetical protein
MAAAAKADPRRIPLKSSRQRHRMDDARFKRARSIAVLKAAAEAYGWDLVPAETVGTGNILTGRGMAYLP